MRLWSKLLPLHWTGKKNFELYSSRPLGPFLMHGGQVVRNLIRPLRRDTHFWKLGKFGQLLFFLGILASRIFFPEKNDCGDPWGMRRWLLETVEGKNLCKQEVVFLHPCISTNAETLFLHLLHFFWISVSFLSSGGISVFSPPLNFATSSIPNMHLPFLPQRLPISLSTFTKAIASGSV